MKNIFIVICDCGDGSQRLEWHLTMSEEKIQKLEAEDLYNTYSSGDGFQCREIQFPEDFDLDAFAKQNRITWFEEQEDC